MDNLTDIPDARVCNIISKGPKYILPSYIDFPKCRREIHVHKITSVIVGASKIMFNMMPLRNGILTFLKSLMIVFHFTLVILVFYLQNVNHHFVILSGVSRILI